MSYVAPEILDGTEKPSFRSVVYSFARMVELVHKRCNYPLFSTVRKALCRIPEKRPALTELKAQFLVIISNYNLFVMISAAR